MKKIAMKMLSFVLTGLAFVLGASSGVVMAAATELPNATGTSDSGDHLNADGQMTTSDNVNGIATVSNGTKVDPDFYTQDIDERITKIRPMATPIDQISRYAKAQPSDSFEVKYYSVGTRAITTKLTKNISAEDEKGKTAVELHVADANLFTLDDTIRVVGVKAVTNYKGIAYATLQEETPDLVLCVCGRNDAGNPLVYAVNGVMQDSGQPTGLPDIDYTKAVLVRMGKACGELDVQTGRFNNIPAAEIQYCQNFMIQVEQSTFDKIAAKEANWTFSDIEEDGIYDMRLAMENSFLFGDKNKIYHPLKNGAATWFTKGIWYMAGKEIEVGTWDSEANCAVISDDNLVDITKDLFVGTGVGNKQKILLCGSDLLAAFSKIKSDKFRLKDSVEAWNLKFKSWDTDFGEVLTIHHELFDANEMSGCGLALDPDFLAKKTHVSWTRNILDLKKAGVRNTDAVVLQEVSCLYLRYKLAHARLYLAKAA